MFYYRLTCLTLYFMSPVAILAKTLSKAGLKSLQSSFMISVYVWRMVCAQFWCMHSVYTSGTRCFSVKICIKNENKIKTIGLKGTVCRVVRYQPRCTHYHTPAKRCHLGSFRAVVFPLTSSSGQLSLFSSFSVGRPCPSPFSENINHFVLRDEVC